LSINTKKNNKKTNKNKMGRVRQTTRTRKMKKKRDAFDYFGNTGFKRVTRAGGAPNTKRDIYDKMRELSRWYMDSIVKRTVPIVEGSGRTIVKTRDVKYGLSITKW